MQHLDQQSIRDLEFDQIRERLMGYCVQEDAFRQCAALIPFKHKEDCLEALHQLRELVTIRTTGMSFPAIDFEQLDQEISFLHIKDTVLNEESFHRLYKSNVLTNEMLKALNGVEEVFPRLWEMKGDLQVDETIIQAIAQVFDNKWQVKDNASPELAAIRTAIAHVRRTIQKNFAKVLRDYGSKGFLGDTQEAYLNDRKVLAVYSTHKRKIPGHVIGSSKTGNLTYVEPEINIELNFELDALFDDERKEIRKILGVLTNQIRHKLGDIELWNAWLKALDFLQAKARLAIELEANMPEMEMDENIIELRRAYHPILVLNNRKAGKPTFPQDIRMDKFSRMLVITGPNAGGKSITMKTIGLLQIMVQSGLMVPVAEGSKMSFFHHVLTDIGDNQSIENQLSTYSYRLKRMRYFLQEANRRSLVLLDEFGTGSDPDLGGALAEVFFEELYNKKAFGVITTHYSNIKLKASQLRNAVNACMLFDTSTLQPTYKLSIGQPGSSFTFEVAEINGLEKRIIDAAKSKLSEQKVLMDRMLAELQEEKSKYAGMVENAQQAAHLASKTISEFDKKKEKLEEKLQRQNETIERNNKYLHHGRKMFAFIESYQLRAKNKELLDDIKKFVAMEKTKMEEERREKAIRKKVESQKEQKVKQHTRKEAIKVGSLVRLANSKQTGEVLELDGAKATVAFGVFRTIVDIHKLEFIL
jgi:DNA mismatch repair protein MutS2